MYSDTQMYAILTGDNEIIDREVETQVIAITGQQDDVIVHGEFVYKKIYDDNGESLNASWNQVPVADGYTVAEDAVFVKYSLQSRNEEGIEWALANEWASVRKKRDGLLAETDWRVIKSIEIGVAISDSWMTYRQELRDITTQEDPFDIAWPTVPE